MQKNSCLTVIKNKYALLTAAERKAADFILKNSNDVIMMSVAELSENSGAAKSAIIRCCKSLGFKGYAELKIALAMELSKNKQLNYTPYIEPDDNAGAILDKIFTANIKTLHDTAEKIDRDMLEKVVDILENAKSIYIYAVGTSAGIANDFQYRIMQSGRNAFCFTDIASMKVSTMNIQSGDAAIGISHSGRTVATVDALKLAKKSGAKTVCITSRQSSEITKVSDCAIEVFSDEIQYPVEAVSARIAHISVIDAITVALSAKNYEEAAERSKVTHELVNSIRYGSQK